MTFNIIYTPNSVHYLSFFIWSLLEHSPYKFRLISNGCSPKERAILRKISEQNPRLSYWCFPTHQIEIHGRVLDYLQTMTTEDFFCFMDSDIFAIADLPDFKSIIHEKKLTALFSALPLWVKETESIFKTDFQIVSGTFNQTENDICLGGTYFAIYKNDVLKEMMQFYGISFEQCAYFQLFSDIQQQLKTMGFGQNMFDTGKVINLLLNKHHLNLQNLNVPELCHIGGTSFETTYQSKPLGKKQQLKEVFFKTPLKLLLPKQALHREGKNFRRFYKNAPREEYQINFNQRILHRNPTRQHFLKLYQSLRDKKNIPPPPKFEDIEISHKVGKAHDLYITNFKKYSHFI